MAIMPLDPDLTNKTERALTQLKKIASVRNYLMHYVSFETGDKGRIISNITKVRKGNPVIEYRASVATLDEMTVDLERISHLCLLPLRLHPSLYS